MGEINGMLASELWIELQFFHFKYFSIFSLDIMNDEILHKSFDKKVDGAESTEIYLDCLQGAQASLWKHTRWRKQDVKNILLFSLCI